MKRLYKLSIILCLIFFAIDAYAQNKPLFERVQKAKSEGVDFKVLSNSFIIGKENRNLFKQFINPNQFDYPGMLPSIRRILVIQPQGYPHFQPVLIRKIGLPDHP